MAEVYRRFAGPENGLNIPFGMAFAEGFFFLGNTDEVRRFADQRGDDSLTGRGEKIADLPRGGYNQHWTRNVVVSPMNASFWFRLVLVLIGSLLFTEEAKNRIYRLQYRGS